MAIKMRRGLIADLDRSKLVAGEIVMSTDTGFVGIAKAPNDVLELAKKDDIPDPVIANPSGTATDDLTKIQIGNTIYDIEGGGGSGDGYTKTLLYSNDSGAPRNTAVTLSDNVDNYDALLIIHGTVASGGISDYYMEEIIDSDELVSLGFSVATDMKGYCCYGYSNRYFIMGLCSLNQFHYLSASPGEADSYNPIIFKIYGIKYDGGSSGGAVNSVNGKTGTVVLGLSDLDGDSTHRTVSDAEKSSWNGKLDSLPIASANSLGGIMVGNNLSIDANGVLSATGGGGGASSLADLSDVTITSSPVNKSFLRYNTGAGVWQDEVYEAKDDILSSLFNISNYRWHPFSFRNTTDDEKISLSFLGEKAVYLSFLRSYIVISDSATKSTIIPMSQTIDLSEIYTTGPLAGLKLTVFITVEDGVSYINIKKSTPINLYTYNVSGVFNLLYN